MPHTPNPLKLDFPTAGQLLCSREAFRAAEHRMHIQNVGMPYFAMPETLPAPGQSYIEAWTEKLPRHRNLEPN